MSEATEQVVVAKTNDQHLEAIHDAASTLAGALIAARDDDVPQSLVLPELIAVFRESGMMPAGFSLPGM